MWSVSFGMTKCPSSAWAWSGSHDLCKFEKSDSIPKTVQDRNVLLQTTNRKWYTSYLIAAIAMILRVSLKVIPHNTSLFNWDFCIVVSRRAVPQHLQNFLFHVNVVCLPRQRKAPNKIIVAALCCIVVAGGTTGWHNIEWNLSCTLHQNTNFFNAPVYAICYVIVWVYCSAVWIDLTVFRRCSLLPPTPFQRWSILYYCKRYLLWTMNYEPLSSKYTCMQHDIVLMYHISLNHYFSLTLV